MYTHPSLLDVFGSRRAHYHVRLLDVSSGSPPPISPSSYQSPLTTALLFLPPDTSSFHTRYHLYQRLSRRPCLVFTLVSFVGVPPGTTDVCQSGGVLTSVPPQIPLQRRVERRVELDALPGVVDPRCPVFKLGRDGTSSGVRLTPLIPLSPDYRVPLFEPLRLRSCHLDSPVAVDPPSSGLAKGLVCRDVDPDFLPSRRSLVQPPCHGVQYLESRSKVSDDGRRSVSRLSTRSYLVVYLNVPRLIPVRP